MSEYKQSIYFGCFENKPLEPIKWPLLMTAEQTTEKADMLLLKIELKKIEPTSLISLPEKSRNNTQ